MAALVSWVYERLGLIVHIIPLKQPLLVDLLSTNLVKADRLW